MVRTRQGLGSCLAFRAKEFGMNPKEKRKTTHRVEMEREVSRKPRLGQRGRVKATGGEQEEAGPGTVTD